MIDYTFIINTAIKIIAAIISIVITCQIKPWLEAKIGKEKLDRLVLIVTELVRCAEQMLKEDDPTGEKRKAYVVQQLVDLGYEITEPINAIIESQVLALHKDKEDK